MMPYLVFGGRRGIRLGCYRAISTLRTLLSARGYVAQRSETMGKVKNKIGVTQAGSLSAVSFEIKGTHCVALDCGLH